MTARRFASEFALCALIAAEAFALIIMVQ